MPTITPNSLATNSATHNPTTQNTVQVLYFASLAEEANKDDETLDTTDSTPFELYQSLQAKYHFSLSRDKIAVAINHQIADWHTPLGNKDIVAFIPPVAGG